MGKFTKCSVIGLEIDASPYVYPLVKATFGSVEALNSFFMVLSIPLVTL